MVNILFISNDKRVTGLISYLQPLLQGAINCTSDFDHGLKDVFDKRPVIVFIQRKIAGVSGDVVAQHIKGLLRDNRPKIVLLQDEGENIPTSSSYDDSLGFSLPEPEIYKVFSNYLKKYPELQWRDQQPHGEATPEPAAKKEVSASEPATAQAMPPKKTAEKVAPKNSAVQKRDEEPLPPQGERMELAADPKDIPFQPVSPRKPALIFPAIIGAVLAIAVIGWLMADHSFSISSSSTSSSPQQKSARTIHLPAAVLLSPADPGFAAANPGWQRYRSNRIEFRVYNEKGKTRVIQAVGVDDTLPIDKVLYESFLLDLFGSSETRTSSTATKDGLLVEKGEISGSAEYILYRHIKTNVIKGFVISFL